MILPLPPLLASGGIFFAFEHSNLAGKGVILLLAVGSIFSWSVMVSKFVYLRRARQENKLFVRRYRNSRAPLDIYREQRRYTVSPAAAVYQAGAAELAFNLLGSTEADETFAARLQTAEPINSVGMSSVRSALERAVGEEGLKMEAQLIVLATAVTGAPFLGLLGTVWGVMDAFSGVALAGQASLAALAPGVSGALITTVTGLVVAIPAMFGYNFLVASVKEMTVGIENFAAECLADFEHKYLKTRG
ncbi:MAG: MotA/TolQ/ExbB proton channel family protein [Verrucomicrobiales bacterium]|jgi:biopolymer transport protein ExbB/TolQ|nr:MotA/TolQ/ExbB proton channel family protein [Verrucomicrobiales bacterium]